MSREEKLAHATGCFSDSVVDLDVGTCASCLRGTPPTTGDEPVADNDLPGHIADEVIYPDADVSNAFKVRKPWH